MSIKTTLAMAASRARMFLGTAFVVAMASPLLAQSGYMVVVHEENATQSLSKSDLSKIFLGRTTSFPSGESARPVDQTGERSVRELFSQDVHGRLVPAIKSYWQRQIFSGRGTPPTELSSDREVLDYVRSNPGGVGYVTEGVAIGPGVRKLDIE